MKDKKCILFLNDFEGVKHSYSYFPILVDAKIYRDTRDNLYDYLKLYNIFGRRYFYPLISQFPTYRGLTSSKSENLPIATEIAEQVICLPIYPNLEYEYILKITSIIKTLSK